MHIKLKWWFNRVIIQNNELNITFFSKHCQTWLRCYNVWLFSRAIDFRGNFTNRVGGRHLLQLVFLPLQYSNKPPACNKYIANIIAVQLSFVLANQRQVSSIIFRHGKGIEIIGESCNDAVARSIVRTQLPPGTLDEEKPLFLQNS